MDDHDIITLFWNRSEEAISQLSIQYGDLCKRIISGILNNKEDVVECENDVYFKVWSVIPPHWPSSLKAFVCKVARRIALDKYRYLHRQKRSTIEVELATAELENGLAFQIQDSVDQQFDYIELTYEMNEFLETLSKRDRVIFLRRYWFFDSVKEIAVKLNMNENTVKTILFRTRDNLLTQLKKEGFL